MMTPCNLWQPDCQTPDTYVAFRAEFTVSEAGSYTLHHCGASWYRIWLNGQWLSEGPARFDPAQPEYIATTLALTPGKHCLAAQVHHVGCDTRMLLAQAPFLYASLVSDTSSVPLQWQAKRLGAYHSQVRRISPQLGWIEWCDHNKLPVGWQLPGFGEIWSTACKAKKTTPPMHQADLPAIRYDAIKPNLIAEGQLRERLFYAKDDPPMAFALRSLNPKESSEGRWMRFDLGQVRLGCPEIRLRASKGDRLEIGWAESLIDGRVVPTINASLGTSANMDHYILSEGENVIEPLTPKGGRFLEIHLLSTSENADLGEMIFHERSIFPRTAEKSFSSEDPLLNRIWQTGINTLRACAEDAITDNPTRERGQWLGDVANVGLQVGAAGYTDLRVFGRGLKQAAECASPEGIVAALFPGQRAYLSSFALNWIDACHNYFKLTGDRAFLETLFPVALKNCLFFERFFASSFTPDMPNEIWGFIDWGYPAHLKDGRHFALYFHFVSAFNSLKVWSDQLGRNDEIEELVERQHIRTKAFEAKLETLGGASFLRYHEQILALRTCLVPPNEIATCLDYCESYIRDCFPMNETAPDIGIFKLEPETTPFAFVSNPNTITPYFLHFALPVFFENGREAFALEVIRTCWGWCLDQGLTTWPEFFSMRGSHCHRWVDHPKEGGLKVGLRTLPSPDKPFGERKEPAFTLFSKLETPQQEAEAAPLKAIIGIEYWSDILVQASEITKDTVEE